MSNNWLGLGFVLVFAGLILGFMFMARGRKRRPFTFRPIAALLSLPTMVGQAVETGRRLHISLGTGSVGQAETAATLVGLTVLDQVAAVAAVSDKPPVVTTQDGIAMLLAQDTLRRVYADQHALERYDPSAARVAGVTPFSFGGALTTMLSDESVAGTVLVGSVGPEAVLLTEASQRRGLTTLASSDDPSTQALLYASTDHPLVGEDMFAGGAYIARHPGHIASLRAQDILRWTLAAVIVLGTLARTVAEFVK